jgi:quercetin 2,3-dioxygenase
MITVRRAAERYHDAHRGQDAWQTFHTLLREEPLAAGFGALESLNEKRLRPGMRIPHRSRDAAEIITYVHQGKLAYEDSLGRAGVIQAGEFQRMSIGRGVRRIEANTSRADGSHIFQIGLRPLEQGVSASEEQRRFCAAERRGLLCVIGSPDGRKGSLRLPLDALLHSAILDPGQHVVHALAQGRSAWLHIVEGQVSLADFILGAGDGVGVTDDRAVSLTAREATELLLLDLPAARPETAGRSTPPQLLPS